LSACFQQADVPGREPKETPPVSTVNVPPAGLNHATIFACPAVDPIDRFRNQLVAQHRLAELEREVRSLAHRLSGALMPPPTPQPAPRCPIKRRQRNSAWLVWN
jgi:hypothetical protein